MKPLHCGGMHCDPKTGAVVPKYLARKRRTKLVRSSSNVRVPRRIIAALLDEALDEHADILTELSWNPGYGVKCTLFVAELRELSTCLAAKGKS